jgi:anti-sigma factor RsiW
MHIELSQLIAYRDGALDSSERKMIEQKLKECEECRVRYAALEHISVSLKDYFSTYIPSKSSDCPDEALWSKYLNGELKESDEAQWKKHLKQCDYCFDIVSSQLVKETAAAERIQMTEWLQQKASEASNVRLTVQDRWREFVAKLRDSFTMLSAPPKWAYVTATMLILALFAGWLVREQIMSKPNINMAKLPGESVKLSDGSYQMVAISEKLRHKKLPGSSEQLQQWYNALMAKEQPRSTVALLTPSFVEALNMLAASQKDQGIEHLMKELESQVIETPSQTIDGVLIDQELTNQLVQKTYTLNQHLLITFLIAKETPSDVRTILKIEPHR